jgi:hypothetical protein
MASNPPGISTNKGLPGRVTSRWKSTTSAVLAATFSAPICDCAIYPLTCYYEYYTTPPVPRFP